MIIMISIPDIKEASFPEEKSDVAHPTKMILDICTCAFSSNNSEKVKKCEIGTPLVAQWIRIHLPMQGTWVPSLVGEQRSHMLQGN